MTKITISVSGAGAETSIEEPGITTRALDSATAAGALNAGSAPSLADATVGALPMMASVDATGVSATEQPIAAGPPPTHLFELSEGGEQ